MQCKMKMLIGAGLAIATGVQANAAVVQVDVANKYSGSDDAWNTVPVHLRSAGDATALRDVNDNATDWNLTLVHGWTTGSALGTNYDFSLPEFVWRDIVSVAGWTDVNGNYRGLLGYLTGLDPFGVYEITAYSTPGSDTYVYDQPLKLVATGLDQYAGVDSDKTDTSPLVLSDIRPDAEGNLTLDFRTERTDNAIYSSNVAAFVITQTGVVPEPASLGLLGLSAAGLLLRRRRHA